MVESMEDGVLMVDSEYRIIVANPSIKKIIKFEDKEVGSAGGKSLNIFDFVDALGGKFDIHGRLEEALVNKNSFVSGRININDSFFEIGVYPVMHSLAKGGSQILGAVAVFNDISRDIELERVREEFTGMIVHELRSPLDGIKKIVELAVSGNIDKNSDQFREYLNMVHQNSSSMLELVNDILDLSKLQAGKFEVSKEKADIKEVIKNRISFYKISADSKKIYLDSHFDNNLPALSEFDPQAIKQILNNFISNALKFTKEGGAILISAFVYDPKKIFPEDLDRSKVSVFPEAKDISVKGPSLCIVVSDNGVGIPEESVKDLFHTWKQARLSPVDKESKGTGLGLVIAKSIAEAHGGQVGLVSKEGVGSSFFFTIPLN
jgi:signal transduction histidine kinase